MKIKTSEKLNEMYQELFDIDFEYVDDILSSDTDYYIVPDRTQAEDGVEAGMRLCELSKKSNKPVWEVSVDSFDGRFTAYFVGTLSEVKKIFKKRLDEAKKDLKEEDYD